MKFIPIPEFFYFNHRLFIEFLLYFYLGYLYSHYKCDTYNLYSLYLGILFLGLSVVFFIQRESISGILNMFLNNYAVHVLVNFLMSLIGIMTYYYLSVVVKNSQSRLFRMLKKIGTYSAAIYLFHSISMGAVRIIFVDIFNLNSNFYPLISIILFISGIVLPILIVKYIIKKFPILPPLILGVDKCS